MVWLILFLVAVLCLLFDCLVSSFFSSSPFLNFQYPPLSFHPFLTHYYLALPSLSRHVSSRLLGRVIVHVLRGDSEDPLGDFIAINQELELFNPKLADKLQVRCVDHPLDENTSKKISRMSALSSPLTLSCIMSVLINWHCRCLSLLVVWLV